MLRHGSDLTRKRLHAVDGEIGHVREFYFDDVAWIIRHLVVDTGNWLAGREVLISPVVVQSQSDWSHSISVDLTREEVRTSPEISTQRPISRAKEIEYFQHFGWPAYWSVPMEPSSVPGPLPSVMEIAPPAVTPHLRSSREVTGYHLHAADGLVGHVEDFLIDDSEWRIPYLVIDTRNWWPGKKVLLSPGWVETIAWENKELVVDLRREKIRGAPPYNTQIPIDRAYEERLHDYYGRPKYWL